MASARVRRVRISGRIGEVSWTPSAEGCRCLDPFATNAAGATHFLGELLGAGKVPIRPEHDTYAATDEDRPADHQNVMHTGGAEPPTREEMGLD
jgi:hypothetical protein